MQFKHNWNANRRLEAEPTSQGGCVEAIMNPSRPHRMRGKFQFQFSQQIIRKVLPNTFGPGRRGRKGATRICQCNQWGIWLGLSSTRLNAVECKGHRTQDTGPRTRVPWATLRLPQNFLLANHQESRRATGYWLLVTGYSLLAIIPQSNTAIGGRN